jgi:hypothetical protein
MTLVALGETENQVIDVEGSSLDGCGTNAMLAGTW